MKVLGRLKNSTSFVYSSNGFVKGGTSYFFSVNGDNNLIVLKCRLVTNELVLTSAVGENGLNSSPVLNIRKVPSRKLILLVM
jgi:hypothetical protein